MSEPKRRKTLPRTTRLRSRREFDRVFAEGARALDACFTVFVARRDAGEARLGIGVGRRYGNAVQRNRIKRLIREAFRRIRHDLPEATDWVVLPRPGVEPSVPEIQQSLLAFAQRVTHKLGTDAVTPTRSAGRPWRSNKKA